MNVLTGRSRWAQVAVTGMVAGLAVVSAVLLGVHHTQHKPVLTLLAVCAAAVAALANLTTTVVIAVSQRRQADDSTWLEAWSPRPSEPRR